MHRKRCYGHLRHQHASHARGRRGRTKLLKKSAGSSPADFSFGLAENRCSRLDPLKFHFLGKSSKSKNLVWLSSHGTWLRYVFLKEL